jgi:NtrC-family two-component system sensor histidine kinase KinB
MTRRKVPGLRARFLLAGSVLVLTTVAASAWTLLVLSRLASVAATTVRETDEATGATAAVATSLEREDDALLLILGGAAHGQTTLEEARAATDRERDRLQRDLAGQEKEQMKAELDASVHAYRAAVDSIVSAPGAEPLERYHREANPLLRIAVATVRKARDERFEEARAATARARDEADGARRVVIVISLLAMGTAVAVALRLARHVIVPLQRLSKAAEQIRDGNFEARIDALPGDEIGRLSEAVNAMAQRLAEFHRSNLGEILRAKQALESVLQALPDAVLLIDADGRVASMNPAAERLFKEADRSPPRSVRELVRLEAESSRLSEALRGERALERVDLGAALRVDVGGEARQLVPRTVPLVVAGEREGIILVLSDVTELARVDEMRTEMVAVASHELRTPVTTLRMSLTMLRERAGQLDPRTRDLLDNALGAIEQLGETVDELLDMTRIEAGGLKLTMEPVDLGSVVREVAVRSWERADELGVQLDVVAERDVPIVSGDRARLRIVVENIVGNALKYTPRGGRIEIRVAKCGGGEGGGAPGVRVAVTDSGHGIPAEFRSRVFEKFFRVEHYRPGGEEGPRGSGIGLYLCREIVGLHGGAIRCECPAGGHGTRVCFEVPAGEPMREAG